MMVTIRDVAEHAGVNASTVSRALKDSPSISSQTKERIRKSMEELNYVPNAAAKMLASGLTHSVGLIFPPMSSKEMKSQPFYMEVLTEINQAASQLGYTIVIATGASSQELLERVRYMEKERRVDGFILLYSTRDNLIQQHLLTSQLPFVMVGTPVQFENETIFVDNDNKLMAKTAVSYLYDQGHRRMLFVTDNLDGEVQLERWLGYQLGMQELKLPTESVKIFSERKPASLDQLAAEIKDKAITALIVIDDRLSLKVSQFLSFHGMKVPDQISIVSFNNSSYAKLIHPYLTSFDINIASLGRSSFTRLYEKIQGEGDGGTKIIVPFSLKERESVRPAQA